MQIKAIIFDLGGVIINLDYTKTIAAFRKLGARNIESIYNPLEGHQSILFNKFEAGDLTPAEFRSEIKTALDFSATDEEFDQAWNAMLLDVPQDRLNIIADLKFQKYEVFLYSNTNKIHFDAIARILNQSGYNGRLFPSYFNNEYYSFTLKMRKPDPYAFRTIIKQEKLEPRETLFIDDSLKNIQGAQSAGLYTFYLTKDRQFSDIPVRLQELKRAYFSQEHDEVKKDRKDENSCRCALV